MHAASIVTAIDMPRKTHNPRSFKFHMTKGMGRFANLQVLSSYRWPIVHRDHPHHFHEENHQNVHEPPIERRATFDELRSLMKSSVLCVDLCDTPKASKIATFAGLRD